LISIDLLGSPRDEIVGGEVVESYKYGIRRERHGSVFYQPTNEKRWENKILLGNVVCSEKGWGSHLTHLHGRRNRERPTSAEIWLKWWYDDKMNWRDLLLKYEVWMFEILWLSRVALIEGRRSDKIQTINMIRYLTNIIRPSPPDLEVWLEIYYLFLS